MIFVSSVCEVREKKKYNHFRLMKYSWYGHLNSVKKGEKGKGGNRKASGGD